VLGSYHGSRRIRFLGIETSCLAGGLGWYRELGQKGRWISRCVGVSLVEKPVSHPGSTVFRGSISHRCGKHCRSTRHSRCNVLGTRTLDPRSRRRSQTSSSTFCLPRVRVSRFKMKRQLPMREREDWCRKRTTVPTISDHVGILCHSLSALLLYRMTRNYDPLSL
jgi:hypothetical protein